MEIKEILERAAASKEQIYSQWATVTEVNEEARTINALPINGDPELFDISLQAEDNKANGLVIFPVLDSQVVLTFISKEYSFVSLTTDIDKILLNTDSFIINGGGNGGLININSLVEKINTLEQQFNTLKNALSGWVPIPNDGGAGLKASISSFAGSLLENTKASEIEDNKITH